MDQMLSWNLETMFRNYLKKVNLNIDTLPENQLHGMRDTFYAACGMILTMVGEELPLLSDEDAMIRLTSFNRQVKDYFDTRIKNTEQHGV